MIKRTTLRQFTTPQNTNNNILLLMNKYLSYGMFYNRHQSGLVELSISFIYVVLYNRVIAQDIFVTTSSTFSLCLSFLSQ